MRYDLREEEKWRRRIVIGRDAAAFFSDLNFRFLLMHHINLIDFRTTSLRENG